MRERSLSAAQGARERDFGRAPAIFAIAVLAAAPLFAGTNVLANGEFPNDTKPWWAPYPIYWSHYDHANSTSSGSARFTQPASFVASVINSEGAAISGNQEVSAGGYFRTVAAAPSGAVVEVAIRFSSASPVFNSSRNRFECPSTWISAVKSPKSAVSSNWSTTSVSTTAPSTARCAQVLISGIDNVPPHDGFDLLSDGIYLNVETEPLPSTIFTSGFESGTTQGWTVVP